MNRSYDECARLVVEHVFPASELVPEETTTFSFLLDNLLPTRQTAAGKHSHALVRKLVTSLVSCNHGPEALNSLVAQVKGFLNRALIMPESNEQRNCLKSLTALLSNMAKSSPTTDLQPQQPLTSAFKQENLEWKMLTQDLACLARIPHSLDMPSLFTVNAALKPLLEALSRIVNHPPTAPIAG